MASTLLQLLEMDLQNTITLESVLLAERLQLEQQDIAALSKTLIDKAGLLASIESNDEARRELLKAEGYATDNSGMREYCAANAGALAMYEELQETLRQCAGLTDINGAIVHRSRLNTSNILDILRGKVREPGLYTNQGGTSKPAESTAIGKA